MIICMNTMAKTNINFTTYFIGCLFNAHTLIHSDIILIPYYV